MTREELARVAKEMGIDPAYLDRAIQDRMSSGKSPGFKFLGAELSREVERVVPGELPPEDFDVVMDEIGPRRKTQFTTQVGRSLNSSISSGLGHGHLSVTSRDGRTRLRTRSLAIFPGLITIYPAFIGTVIALAKLSESHLVVPQWLPATLAVGIFALAWGVFVVLSRRSHDAMKHLVDRIADRIAEVTNSNSAKTGAESPASLEDRLKD